jgi:DNA-directed RNA polymerase subunit alpha
VAKECWVTLAEEGKDYAKFMAEPLPKGYGITLGNALRRVMLSSLEGAAIVAVEINGVSHEFEQLPGVKEDTLDIILNLKGIVVKSFSETMKEVKINFKGKGEITAKDIKHDEEIEIINPSHHIATVTENSKVEMTLWINRGIGYSQAENQEFENPSVNLIPLDADFSPVKKVNSLVENTRVGKQTDFDKLLLEIWTNNSILPQEALKSSADILINKFKMFTNYDETEVDTEEVKSSTESTDDENLDLTVEDLELSARSSNCLKRAGIKIVRELIAMDMEDLMKIKNFGQKSADEINAKLEQFGYQLKEAQNSNEQEEVEEEVSE